MVPTMSAHLLCGNLCMEDLSAAAGITTTCVHSLGWVSFAGVEDERLCVQQHSQLHETDVCKQPCTALTIMKYQQKLRN